MKAILLPLILTLLGVGSGVGAGLYLQPETSDVMPATEECACALPVETSAAPLPAVDDAPREYAKLNNQFVIPVVEDGLVAALVVMSLNVEVVAGNREMIFATEPKLRDRFLQVMFNHANIGGFSGNFTAGTNMRALRNELLRVAQEVGGPDVTDVLVIDIVRQDS